MLGVGFRRSQNLETEQGMGQEKSKATPDYGVALARGIKSQRALAFAEGVNLFLVIHCEFTAVEQCPPNVLQGNLGPSVIDHFQS